MLKAFKRIWYIWVVALVFLVVGSVAIGLGDVSAGVVMLVLGWVLVLVAAFETRDRRGKSRTVVAVSGGFDPLHVGHVRMFRDALTYGGRLVVILNGDEFLMQKKGRVFMPYVERKELLEGLRDVSEVIGCVDRDMSVCQTLRMLRPAVFANGGDRRSEEDILEAGVCRSLGIEMVFGVGGDKVQSSSRLVEQARR